jgi:hypothetical protein
LRGRGRWTGFHPLQQRRHRLFEGGATLLRLLVQLAAKGVLELLRLLMARCRASGHAPAGTSSGTKSGTTNGSETSGKVGWSGASTGTLIGSGSTWMIRCCLPMSTENSDPGGQRLYEQVFGVVKSEERNTQYAIRVDTR